MRLYLSIIRNSLPPVKTVWPLTNIQQGWTIAQLLENINETFPLESEHWGLEDYVVTIAGYECLFHHVLFSICKENDELTIRPLQTAEVRARGLSGRHQISNAGRHLIDGYAFGKPALKSPVRPDIRIPPRKRRKLSAEEEDTQGEMLMLENGEQKMKGSGSSHSDSDDDDEDSDFNSTSSGVSSTSQSSSEADSDSESSASWNGLNEPLSNSKSIKDSTNLGNAHAAQYSSPRDDVSSGPHAREGAEDSSPNLKGGIPHQGRQHTKARNLRRRNKRRLDYLKSQGIVPEDSTFADLAKYNQGEAIEEEEVDETYDETMLPSDEDRQRMTSRTAAFDQALQARKSRLIDALLNGGIDVNDHSFLDEPAGRVEKLVLDNSEAPPARGKKIVFDDNDEPPEQFSSKGVPSGSSNERQMTDDNTNAQTNETTATTASPLSMVPPSVAARRVRLDVASSQRLVFGSLGVRVPKTDIEKARVRSKLAGGLQNGTSHAQNGLTKVSKAPAVQPVTGIEDWQSKINLSAVECCDEDVVLSAPSFPFERFWDPQYPGPSKQKNKRKRESQAYAQDDYTESYDKYNTSGNGDALNYDDVDEEALYQADETQSHDQQVEQDESSIETDDDFPPLPEDVTTLELLHESDAQPGNHVVFPELVCDTSTNWQPKLVNRTIMLLDKTAYGWMVKLARRDLAPRSYDDEGNRVYKKFEMAGMDDDEGEDQDVREYTWQELGEARLLPSI